MIERITVAVGPIEASNVAIAPVLLTVKIEESFGSLPMIGLPLSVFKFLAYFASDIPDILKASALSPFQLSKDIGFSSISVYVIFNEPLILFATSAVSA